MSRILVVDDDRAVRVLLKSILVKDSHEVIESPDGSSALVATREERPDLILLDLMLPDYNGLEVLSALKEDRDLEAIPVIVLTGSSDRQSKLTALSSGAVDFISKPFMSEEVLLRVNTQLKLHNLIKSLRVAVDNLQSDVLAAGRIQAALVPQNAPQGLKMEWIYSPSYRVGGDIFDVVKLGEEKFFVYLADMSGHGVNAAMLSVMVHRFIEDYRGRIGEGEFDLKDFMAELDSSFRFEKFNLFFTIISMIIDTASKKLLLCNAGHPSPMLMENERLRVLENKEGLIGMNMIRGSIEEINLSEGDRLILYTDGFTESTNEDGEMFGEERLRNILLGCRDMSLSATIENLRDRFEKFKGSKKAEDDVSLLLIEF